MEGLSGAHGDDRPSSGASWRLGEPGSPPAAVPAATPAALGIPGLADLAPIGRGGFATVYRARQPEFDRQVAVKVLTGLAIDEEDRARYARELRAQGIVSSNPAIVTVFSAGVTGDGHPYVVMDFMPGGSLADRLRRDGTMPWADVVAVGVRIAGALEDAHRHGVLHRDIKPENILVNAYGDSELCDFGIARVEGSIETRAGLTATVAHCAPELLAEGARPTVGSDIYALGSTLRTLLAGRAPFAAQPGEPLQTQLARICTMPPAPLAEHGIPERLCRVLDAMVAKRPEQRPASAAAAAWALWEAAGREAGTPRPSVPEPARPLVPGAAVPPPPASAASTDTATISPPAPPSRPAPHPPASAAAPVPPTHPSTDPLPPPPAAPVPSAYPTAESPPLAVRSLPSATMSTGGRVVPAPQSTYLPPEEISAPPAGQTGSWPPPMPAARPERRAIVPPRTGAGARWLIAASAVAAIGLAIALLWLLLR